MVNDLRNVITKYDQANTSTLKKDGNLDGYFFKVNSIDYIKNIFNTKLDEFVTNFFTKDELIRGVLRQNYNVLEDINSAQFTYFYPMMSQSIEAFHYGPSAFDKMTTLIKYFEKNYKSDHYKSPITNSATTNYNKKSTRTTSTQNSKNGCFVATFAYESYEHQNVIILRKFRDENLNNSSYGKLFIKNYYKYSPSLVLLLEKIKFPKAPIRFLLKGILLIIPQQRK
jgi:hypothetical protein